MDVEEMYEEFRIQFPDLTLAADARHVKIWDSVERETAYVWFESLANTLNTMMATPEHRTDFSSIFNYFDEKFRVGNKDEKNCIEVSFVENLFWQVGPRHAAPVWARLPTRLQQLYIGFHGRAPKLD